jgi:hypothetical protein
VRSEHDGGEHGKRNHRKKQMTNRIPHDYSQLAYPPLNLWFRSPICSTWNTTAQEPLPPARSSSRPQKSTAPPPPPAPVILSPSKDSRACRGHPHPCHPEPGEGQPSLSRPPPPLVILSLSKDGRACRGPPPHLVILSPSKDSRACRGQPHTFHPKQVEAQPSPPRSQPPECLLLGR